MTRQEARRAESSLAHRASRGALQTIGGQWSRTALQLISTVLLARLLAPEDFGLVAMVTAIVGVADLVREFGLSGAIVRLKEISDETWASLYRFSLVLGFATMAAAAGSAPLIAALYGDERLVPLTFALAPIVLFNSIAMPLQARLQRELRFGVIAVTDVISMAIGVLGSVIAAFLGAGVWSLVLLTGLGALYRVIAMVVVVRPRFGNAAPFRELLPVLGTGSSIFGVQVLNYAARNLDNVFIGRVLGPTVLGVYSRAYALLMLPISQLNGPLARVGLPVLSRLQDDPEGYRRYVRASMIVISYAAIPTFAFAAAVAGPLVDVLLGSQWADAAPIFAVLCIAGVAQAIGNVSGWIYVSLGRAHRQLVYFVVTKPLVIASFAVGLWWNGVMGLALLYGIVSCVLLIPGFLIAIKGTFVRAGDIFGPVIRPLVLAVPLYFAAVAVLELTELPSILELLVAFAGALVPVALSLAIPHYRRDLRTIIGVLLRARKGKA